MYYNTPLNNLDELANLVRNKNSQNYIKEAIIAYRNGAFRSAIMATWITCLYDIIEKIKELKEYNDKDAIQFCNRLNNAIASKQIEQFQKIENAVLKKAFEDYQFISKYEYDLLEILKSHRNLCAHPAYATDLLLYQPTPEQTRTHIVHCIQFVLMHPPIQGKTALERIRKDIQRESYPDSVEDIRNYIQEKYLKQTRQSFVENLIRILSKIIINNNTDFIGKEKKIFNTLVAISMIRPQLCKDEIVGTIEQVIDKLEDENLLTILDLLLVIPESWNGLKSHSQTRIKQVLKQQLNGDLKTISKYELLNKIDIEDFKDDKKVLLEKIKDNIEDNILKYQNAGNYNSARTIGIEDILPYLEYFTKDHLKKTIRAVLENHNEQIRDAYGSDIILVELFDKTKKLLDICLVEEWVKLKDFVEQANGNDKYSILIKRIEKVEQEYNLFKEK